MAKTQIPPEMDTARRARAVRRLIAGDNQTVMATRLGIGVKRWNNFERNSPLTRDVALILVKVIPGLTTDWLFLGREDGLPLKLQRELAEADKLEAEAGKATTSAGARA